MDVQIFDNSDFGAVRSMMINEEPWFVGRDVCAVFGDTNHNRSLSRVDDEDKTENQIVDAMGRPQRVIMINESGLYSLLFTMQPKKGQQGWGVRCVPHRATAASESLQTLDYRRGTASLAEIWQLLHVASTTELK